MHFLSWISAISFLIKNKWSCKTIKCLPIFAEPFTSCTGSGFFSLCCLSLHLLLFFSFKLYLAFFSYFTNPFSSFLLLLAYMLLQFHSANLLSSKFSCSNWTCIKRLVIKCSAWLELRQQLSANSSTKKHSHRIFAGNTSFLLFFFLHWLLFWASGTPGSAARNKIYCQE